MRTDEKKKTKVERSCDFVLIFLENSISNEFVDFQQWRQKHWRARIVCWIFVANEKSIVNFRIRCQQCAATYPTVLPTNHTKRVLFVGLLFSQGTTFELIPVYFPRVFPSTSALRRRQREREPSREAVQTCGSIHMNMWITEYRCRWTNNILECRRQYFAQVYLWSEHRK